MNELEQAAARIPRYDPESLHIDAARELLLTQAAPVTGTETLAPAAALDRILAEDVLSPMAVPPHDNAAMDGYALRGADLREDAASRLRNVGTALAGRPGRAPWAPGSACAS